MDIANLQAFAKTAACASFSLAAQQLHLTQPAISKRIAALETELGVRLFDRIGRKVSLTEAGRTLLPRARRILAEVEDSRRALSNLSGKVSGVLTLATSHHIGLHRLPPLLREFAARYPQVQLDMRFTDSELACAAVGRGEAELGIVTLPPCTEPPLICTPVWVDPLAIVVNREHPLARASQVQPAELGGYPAILPGEITFTRRIVADFLDTHGVSLKVAFSTNYLETIKMMVAVGLGWSVLPRSMLDAETCALPVTGFALQRRLGVVRHNGQTLSNAARALLDLLPKMCQMP